MLMSVDPMVNGHNKPKIAIVDMGLLVILLKQDPLTYHKVGCVSSALTDTMEMPPENTFYPSPYTRGSIQVVELV